MEYLYGRTVLELDLELVIVSELYRVGKRLFYLIFQRLHQQRNLRFEGTRYLMWIGRYELLRRCRIGCPCTELFEEEKLLRHDKILAILRREEYLLWIVVLRSIP